MSYSSNGIHPKLSEKGLLKPDNCLVTLIGQPQMLFGTSNFDRQTIINNTAAFACGAHHGRNQVLQRQHVASTPSCIPGPGAHRAFIDELLVRQELRSGHGKKKGGICLTSFLPKADTSEQRYRAPAEQAGAFVRTQSASIQHAQAFRRISLF